MNGDLIYCRRINFFTQYQQLSVCTYLKGIFQYHSFQKIMCNLLQKSHSLLCILYRLHMIYEVRSVLYYVLFNGVVLYKERYPRQLSSVMHTIHRRGVVCYCKSVYTCSERSNNVLKMISFTSFHRNKQTRKHIQIGAVGPYSSLNTNIAL